MPNIEFECPCDRHIEINATNIPGWSVPSDVYGDRNVYFIPPNMESAFQAKIDEVFGD